ncbi:unnamed protein product [Nezara viridula]|uniref:Rho guanine nucleotide exchange factor 18 n=1 Tax=Nezara viridula TaxID=85310 RepID=A0A9P0DZV8_NEZVI|nr:unnamed protein product [Nezara viridula]
MNSDEYINLPQYISDEWCGESSGSEDLITDYIGGEEMSERHSASGPSPLVPTISVTPLSLAEKDYPILEDNLQQLHYIHESVQQMRELIVQPVRSQEASRLSASCPSLNDAGSDPDLVSSLNSTPPQILTLTTPATTHSLPHKRGSGEWKLYRRNMGLQGDIEVSRRRSWSALEDLTHYKDSTKASCHRSGNELCGVSLNSVESDMDDPFCESTTNLLGTHEVTSRVRQTHTHINSSTHSLNEAEFHNVFKKVESKSEAETRLINARISLPLQKSVTVNDLDTDPFLGLQDEEPDSWTSTVTKEVMKELNKKEIKRQEHYYEFIMTEKNHCLTLRVMQKVFVEGLQKYLKFGANVQRMFPRLVDLSEIHLGFLHKLRTRQREAPVIQYLGDILESQFSGACAERLKAVYGEFCSNHHNAISIYKDYIQHDTRFAEFIKNCQANPLLKKKGIPECILFVTQRLTKYPLLIDALIKMTKDNEEEQGRLERSLTLVKEILVEVDAQVAEKEKEDRKLEIYNKLEAKSYAIHRGHKFKKADILGANRKLRFEGIAMLMQGRGKMQVVLVIVFSDVLCFLLENNHKYSFFTPENKDGVVSLQKLLVREKAGQESRGIYLISSNPNEPEMFELKVHNPKDKQVWIKAIRAAVQNCPEDDKESRGLVLSAEEKQKQFDTKQKHIKEIVEILRQKDHEQAQILEEKMALQLKLLATAGLENVPERPNYMSLVSEQLDNIKIRKDVLTAVKNLNQLAKSLYTSATNLSQSASSVGERQIESCISPTSSVRAETLGGLENQDAEDDFESPLLLMTGQDHQLAATELSHHVYTLSCIISQQMTTIDSLEADLTTLKSHLGDSGKTTYRHNQQLEELRNLQDKLQSEKEIWQRERDSELNELEQRREELLQLQEQIRLEQADIIQQREKLYRKLETLSSQGIVMSPTLAGATTSPDDISWTNTLIHTPPSDRKRKSDSMKWKSSTVNKSATLPLNLISTTNQQKVSSNVQIKQQLPLKLSTKLGNSGNSTVASATGSQQMLPLKLREGTGGDAKKTSALSTTPQLPSHSRTGSSPATMQNIQGESKAGVKAARTNTYPKLPDKFRIRSSEANQIPTYNTEEVIFF